MTFQNIDEIMTWLEQFCADKQREFATTMLLRDPDEITDDIGDVIDGCREWHEEAMVQWRIDARRQLEAMPFKFPCTVTYEDARRRR